MELYSPISHLTNPQIELVPLLKGPDLDCTKLPHCISDHLSICSHLVHTSMYVSQTNANRYDVYLSFHLLTPFFFYTTLSSMCLKFVFTKS